MSGGVVAGGLLAMFACGAAAQGPAATATAPAPPSAINIPFESYALPNGLTVILSPDRTTPTVAVNIWYHVGSKNELPGRTGFAHLFEHVMFTGSGHVPYGLHDKLTEGVGGGNNGTTSNDRTTYFETVPSNYLESALWLESDRMGFLLETLDIAKLNAQRDIVKNERRQGVDNQPYGRVDEILAEATYPPVAPVFVGRHRQHGGPVGRLRGGREVVLPRVLRAEQRHSGCGRRFRSGRCTPLGRAILRGYARGAADHASDGRPCVAAIP